jgi:hypothetical protein
MLQIKACDSLAKISKKDDFRVTEQSSLILTNLQVLNILQNLHQGTERLNESYEHIDIILEFLLAL